MIYGRNILAFFSCLEFCIMDIHGFICTQIDEQGGLLIRNFYNKGIFICYPISQIPTKRTMTFPLLNQSNYLSVRLPWVNSDSYGHHVCLIEVVQFIFCIDRAYWPRTFLVKGTCLSEGFHGGQDGWDIDPYLLKIFQRLVVLPILEHQTWQSCLKKHTLIQFRPALYFFFFF